MRTAIRSAADIEDVGWPDPAAVVHRMLSTLSWTPKSASCCSSTAMRTLLLKSMIDVSGLTARKQRSQVIAEQVIDPFDHNVRRWVGGQFLRIMGVVPLAREDSRHLRPPDALHRGQDAQLVIHQDVVRGRATFCDIVQLLLFVNIDQHAAVDGVIQPRTLD